MYARFMAGLSISQVAERTGLSIHTLRYYERAGLIIGVGRADNGHRCYAEADVVWLEFLKRLRATGMPMSQMKHFADLRRQGDASRDERAIMLEKHFAAVEKHIAGLNDNLHAICEKLRRLRGAALEGEEWV